MAMLDPYATICCAFRHLMPLCMSKSMSSINTLCLGLIHLVPLWPYISNPENRSFSFRGIGHIAIARCHGPIRVLPMHHKSRPGEAWTQCLPEIRPFWDDPPSQPSFQWCRWGRYNLPRNVYIYVCVYYLHTHTYWKLTPPNPKFFITIFSHLFHVQVTMSQVGAGNPWYHGIGSRDSRQTSFPMVKPMDISGVPANFPTNLVTVAHVDDNNGYPLQG